MIDELEDWGLLISTLADVQYLGQESREVTTQVKCTLSIPGPNIGNLPKC
jgi:hypothetical protein